MIRQMRCEEAKRALDAGQIRLIDVRTDWEHEIAAVPGSELLDPGLLVALRALPKDTPIAFLCHHGVRSQDAARHFQQLGFVALANVVGGIDAWSREVDPTVPTY